MRFRSFLKNNPQITFKSQELLLILRAETIENFLVKNIIWLNRTTNKLVQLLTK